METYSLDLYFPDKESNRFNPPSRVQLKNFNRHGNNEIFITQKLRVALGARIPHRPTAARVGRDTQESKSRIRESPKAV
jgi:hypothetical protein